MRKSSVSPGVLGGDWVLKTVGLNVLLRADSTGPDCWVPVVGAVGAAPNTDAFVKGDVVDGAPKADCLSVLDSAVAEAAPNPVKPTAAALEVTDGLTFVGVVGLYVGDVGLKLGLIGL